MVDGGACSIFIWYNYYTYVYIYIYYHIVFLSFLGKTRVASVGDFLVRFWDTARLKLAH